jgi:gas vesicle protein
MTGQKQIEVKRMSDNTGRFFEGLVVGGILGFIFGMLSAPKSGAEMRQQLADGSEDLYKQASDQISDLKDKTNRTITDLQAKSEVAIKRASDTVQEKKQVLTSKIQDLTKQGKAMAEDVESITPS